MRTTHGTNAVIGATLNQATAQRRPAVKIRHVAVATMVCTLTAATAARAADPLRLVQTIPLPGVEGRIDHFAWDAKGKRLFVAALGNNTVEVVDLTAGKVGDRIKDLQASQGIR